jgi:hypothetical protein
MDTDFDPAGLGWPPTLPLEIAMAEMPVREICESYGLDRTDWARLRVDEKFVAQVDRFREELMKDGVSFQMKARLQAEVLLKESWRMIHAPDAAVPAAVKADLIKSTMKWAGVDQSAKAGAMGQAPALQINIQFQGKVPTYAPMPTAQAKTIEGTTA